MAMLIAWQTLNKAATPENKLYSKRFLVITSGFTSRDRLRVLLPSDPDNYYRLRDLVPADLRGGLGQSQIVITNYHAFLPRELAAGRGVSRLTKDVLIFVVVIPRPPRPRARSSLGCCATSPGRRSSSCS